jgi:heme oxygenase (biliverdin-producing, ferredoxin)
VRVPVASSGAAGEVARMSTSLARRLRDETRALHVAAERSGVMRALLRGALDRAAYARLLRALHVLYAALERGLADHAERPAVAAVHDPALARADRLAQDLDLLAGPGWAGALPVPAAARAYAARLDHLAAADPDLLVAHAYVRYLGDLSGGQHVARAVRRALALEGTRGTAFYEFPALGDLDAFKGAYRAALDALPVDAAGAARLVGEARWAFAAHVALFEALDATPATRA